MQRSVALMIGREVSQRRWVLLDNLHKLDRRLDVNDVGGRGALTLQKFCFDRHGDAASATDEYDLERKISPAQRLPVADFTRQNPPDYIPVGFANRIGGMNGKRDRGAENIESAQPII